MSWNDFRVALFIVISLWSFMFGALWFVNRVAQRSAAGRFVRNMACIEAGGTYTYQNQKWVCIN